MSGAVVASGSAQGLSYGVGATSSSPRFPGLVGLGSDRDRDHNLCVAGGDLGSGSYGPRPFLVCRGHSLVRPFGSDPYKSLSTHPCPKSVGTSQGGGPGDVKS